MFALDKPLTWVIILVIVLLIFGAGKLPDIGKSLGKSIKEFKDETSNGANGVNKDNVTATTVVPPASNATPTMSAAGSMSNGTGGLENGIRRRIIKHPDGREEIIEERV